MSTRQRKCDSARSQTPDSTWPSNDRAIPHFLIGSSTSSRRGGSGGIVTVPIDGMSRDLRGHACAEYTSTIRKNSTTENLNKECKRKTGSWHMSWKGKKSASQDH